MRTSRLLYLLSGISLLFPLLAACAAPGSANEPEPLIVYSGRSETLVAPLIEQFSQATGIPVEVRYGSTAEIAATILEEGANSPADVFFAQDPGGLGAVAAASLLAQLPEETLARIPERWESPDGLWIGVSGRARVVAYNTERIDPATLPTDIWDFVDGQWQGRLGWAPTNASFQAMVTAMRVVWGEQKTRDWLDGIIANQPVAYENNTALVQAVAAGEIDLGFTNHYYLQRFIEEEGSSFTARPHFLTGGGPGSLVMVAGVGMLASSERQDTALRFIDFLLSPVAQQFFASQTFEYPLVSEGVNTPAELLPFDQLNALEIDLKDLADLQGTLDLLSAAGALP